MKMNRSYRFALIGLAVLLLEPAHAAGKKRLAVGGLHQYPTPSYPKRGEPSNCDADGMPGRTSGVVSHLL